jgi:hypothetical protein
MVQPEIISFSSIPKLFNLKGLYLLAYAGLFGMSYWVSFFGGVIAYKTLPRQQFGNLQHKTFPIYFFNSIIISSGLLGYWAYTHPDVLAYATNPRVADVAQAYTLASVIAAQGINYWVIGPMTSRLMFKRHKQEREEGKQYNDPGVSDQMKQMNKKFGMLHGISSLANLGAVVALTFHGLWLGNAGLIPK